MVKDLTADQCGLEALRRFSYRPMETEPNMVLTIDPAWLNYEDYLNALDAKYRRNAKDQAKKLAAAGCVLEHLDDLEPHAARLHELYMAVHNNAAVRLVTVPQSYLPALARAIKNHFRCTVVRKDGSLLGVLGVTVGLGGLSKYNYILFALSLLIAALSVPTFRRCAADLYCQRRHRNCSQHRRRLF
jgi:hypothetical protein